MVGWPVPLTGGGGDEKDRPDPTNHKDPDQIEGCFRVRQWSVRHVNKNPRFPKV